MKALTSPFTEINIKDFTNLKEKLFAEYMFVYRINDEYSVTDLSSFHSKHQLLFQKISEKIKQVNLMIVDSCFSILLSDVVLDVLLNDVTSFAQYVTRKKKIIISDVEFDQTYIKYKLIDFTHHLLYSNISPGEICKGNVDPNKIFCLEDQNKEIQYYTIFERNELQELLFNKMTIEIDFSKSFIHKTNANICFRILFR